MGGGRGCARGCRLFWGFGGRFCGGGEGVRLGVLRGPKGGNVDGERVGGECVPHLGEHVGLGFAVLEKGGC